MRALLRGTARITVDEKEEEEDEEEEEEEEEEAAERKHQLLFFLACAVCADRDTCGREGKRWRKPGERARWFVAACRRG